VNRPATRHWRPCDDGALEDILRAQIGADPAWPPKYAHQLKLSTWLGGPADLGRWVAIDDHRILGHIGLGTVNGAIAQGFTAATGYRSTELAECCRMVVDPQSRGLGIASALTRAAIKAAMTMQRIPVATVLTGRGTWLEMMQNTGWQRIGDIEATTPDERLVLLLAPHKFVAALESDGR